MQNASYGIDLLIATDNGYGAQKATDNVARLESLGLCVTIREIRAISAGSRSVFISEIDASADVGAKGITVTAVGMGEDMPSAVKDAVGQWVLGVLPVLASWRGDHSCLASSRQLATRGSAFQLLEGPVVARGISSDGPTPDMSPSLVESLVPLCQKAPLAQRVHWLELYVSKFSDGTIEATCRANNHDWLAGKNVLESIASSWPPSQEPLRSLRQFVILAPSSGDAMRIVQATFWDRIKGRA